MCSVYREEKEGSQIRLITEDGAITALTDRHAWSMISQIEAESNKIKRALIREMIDKLVGQEIFVTVDPKELGLYEDLGFIRSKNAFTYVGRELTEAEEDELTKSGCFLPIGFKYETEFEPFAGSFPVGRKSDKKHVQVTFSSDHDGVDFHRVNELLETAFGDHRDPVVTEDTFLNSEYVQYAYEGDYLIGTARAISDNEHALILNVAVDPEYQGLSLGWRVLAHLADQMPGQTIFLNTHPGGVGFYNQKGFRRNKTALMFPSHPMPNEIKKGFCLPVGYRFPDE